jgi:hypothetical protein
MHLYLIRASHAENYSHRSEKDLARVHLFENSPHGFGMALFDPSLRTWTTLPANWMTARVRLAPIYKQ